MEHTFPYLARALAGEGRPFRLPDSGEPAADAFLHQGCVPVRHALRQGGRTVSWYRGPFVTGATPADPRFGVRTAALSPFAVQMIETAERVTFLRG